MAELIDLKSYDSNSTHDLNVRILLFENVMSIEVVIALILWREFAYHAVI